MGKVIMSGVVPKLVAPSAGLAASDVAEGSIVYFNENGTPAEFYVAKQDYESSLNGAGRTLFVRKYCYDVRQWHSSSVNAYASSDIDSWLNGTYKALLDTAVQNAIGTTKFYYTPGNGNKTKTTLSRGVFLLSLTELNKSVSSTNHNTEGTALPIASTLLIAYYIGTAVQQWTRTPYLQDTAYAYSVNSVGNASCDGVISSSFGVTMCSRPCFTLPSTAKFDEETLLFKGVA